MKRNVLTNIVLTTGISLSALLFTSCEEEEQAAVSPQMPTAEVQVTGLKIKDINVAQEWIATLRGTDDADIKAQVSGYLITKNYRDGAYVKQGDVLFQIDQRPFEATLKQAQGNLAQARALQEKYKLDVERYTALAAKEAIGRKQLDDSRQLLLESEAAVMTAQAAVDQAAINLEFTTIKAPISGLTGIANTSIGDLLSPNAPEPLTTISAIDPIRVDFSISEQDLLDTYGKFDGKQKGLIDFDIVLSNGVKYPYKGKPVAIDRNVNRSTGTIHVIGHIPNTDHLLRPGMYVHVKSVTKTIKNATLVPPRAIYSAQNTEFLVLAIPDGSGTTYDPKVFPVLKGPVDEEMGGRYQMITPVHGELPKNAIIIVEGTTQALQRLDGKGKVIIKEYVDQPDNKAETSAPAETTNEQQPAQS